MASCRRCRVFSRGIFNKCWKSTANQMFNQKNSLVVVMVVQQPARFLMHMQWCRLCTGRHARTLLSCTSAASRPASSCSQPSPSQPASPSSCTTLMTFTSIASLPPPSSLTSSRAFSTSFRHGTAAVGSPPICVSPPVLPVVHGEVAVVYHRGLPIVTVPLPSRRERCHFTLRPISNTVGDFLGFVQIEDRGIDRISIKTVDGVRIAASTTIESLMHDDFHLMINDVIYHVSPPASERLTSEHLERLSDVRHLVSVLYEALSVEEHQLRKERELLQKLEDLKGELKPLEEKRTELETFSSRRTSFLSWLGLGLMATQFGILARLTWWEYSWDIMEPVTYFVTYGTTMAAYAYFVLTKQDYLLPDVKDRQFLITFYKHAKRSGLDVSRYNELKDVISDIEKDLNRLRDPLHLHLPPTVLQKYAQDGAVASTASSKEASHQQSSSSTSPDSEPPSNR